MLARIATIGAALVLLTGLAGCQRVTRYKAVFPTVTESGAAQLALVGKYRSDEGFLKGTLTLYPDHRYLIFQEHAMGEGTWLRRGEVLRLWPDTYVGFSTPELDTPTKLAVTGEALVYQRKDIQRGPVDLRQPENPKRGPDDVTRFTRVLPSPEVHEPAAR